MRRRGHNPTLHAPLAVGDGLLVRLKPPFHRLSSLAARDLAAFAERYQTGPLELTNRGNLQIRGLTPATAALLARWAEKRGLAAADPVFEERRNLVLSPLLDLDPALPRGALTALAEALSAAIAREGTRLPGRIGFTLDGGGAVPLDDVPSPLTLIPLAEGAFEMRSEGGVRRAESAMAAAACAVAWAAEAPPLPPRRRFRPPEAGFLPLGGEKERWGALALAPPLGLIGAAALRWAARWAERAADATLRLSPHRSLLLAPLGEEAARALMPEAEAAGFLTDPADPRLSVIACAGRPHCDGADAPSRADAFRLLSLLPAALPGPVHVAGCAKGCAWRGTAAFTLIGVGEGAGGGVYDLAFDADCDHTGVRANHRLLGITDAAALIAAKATDDAPSRLSP
jgi:precorrin-3B synthase